MKELSVSELMRKENLPLILSGASVADAVQIITHTKTDTQLYLVDECRRLLGVIPVRALLEYLAPCLLLPGTERGPDFIKALETADLNYLVQPEYPAALRHHSLPEVLQELLSTKSSSIPVLDEEKRIIGELCLNQLGLFIYDREREGCHAFS